MEAGRLSCQAGAGGFSVGRKLGIGEHGRIDSLGRIIIGSIFSKMRDLPPAEPSSADERFDLEQFMAQMEEQDRVEECLRLTAEEDIMIDNLQGMVTVNTAKPIKIMLLSVESGRLIVNAPNAEVDLYLRSVDDLSLVNCRKANVYIGEDFEGCQIYD